MVVDLADLALDMAGMAVDMAVDMAADMAVDTGEAAFPPATLEASITTA